MNFNEAIMIFGVEGLAEVATKKREAIMANLRTLLDRKLEIEQELIIIQEKTVRILLEEGYAHILLADEDELEDLANRFTK